MEGKGHDLEQHPDDPGEWEEEVQRRPGHVGSVVFSVRFARDEIAAIRAAAMRAGERTSEFIRVAALQRVRGDSGISIEMGPSTGPLPGGVILFARPRESTQVATPSELVRKAGAATG